MSDELKPCPFCKKIKVGNYTIIVDDTVPDGEIHFKDSRGIVHKIVGIGTEHKESK